MQIILICLVPLESQISDDSMKLKLLVFLALVEEKIMLVKCEGRICWGGGGAFINHDRKRPYDFALKCGGL